jgi:hypothetical protein
VIFRQPPADPQKMSINRWKKASSVGQVLLTEDEQKHDIFHWPNQPIVGP